MGHELALPAPGAALKYILCYYLDPSGWRYKNIEEEWRNKKLI